MRLLSSNSLATGAVAFALTALEVRAQAAAEGAGISTSVALIAGKSPGYAPASRRIAVVRQLPSDLPAADVNALMEMAFGPRLEGMRVGEWAALVNDVLDTLLRQKRPVANLQAKLIEMSRNASDPVLADYAIQKLGAVLRKLPLETDSTAMAAAISKVAATDGVDRQGTALLAWHPVPAGAKDQRRGVFSCAPRLFELEKATDVARITALQIAAEVNPAAACRVARQEIAKKRSSVALKISAIGALGTAGGEADLALLKPLSEDEGLRAAIESAVRRISGRRK